MNTSASVQLNSSWKVRRKHITKVCNLKSTINPIIYNSNNKKKQHLLWSQGFPGNFNLKKVIFRKGFPSYVEPETARKANTRYSLVSVHITCYMFTCSTSLLVVTCRLVYTIYILCVCLFYSFSNEITHNEFNVIN